MVLCFRRSDTHHSLSNHLSYPLQVRVSLLLHCSGFFNNCNLYLGGHKYCQRSFEWPLNPLLSFVNMNEICMYWVSKAGYLMMCIIHNNSIIIVIWHDYVSKKYTVPCTGSWSQNNLDEAKPMIGYDLTLLIEIGLTREY